MMRGKFQFKLFIKNELPFGSSDHDLSFQVKFTNVESKTNLVVRSKEDNYSCVYFLEALLFPQYTHAPFQL